MVEGEGPDPCWLLRPSPQDHGVVVVLEGRSAVVPVDDGGGCVDVGMSPCVLEVVDEGPVPSIVELVDELAVIVAVLDALGGGVDGGGAEVDG